MFFRSESLKGDKYVKKGFHNTVMHFLKLQIYISITTVLNETRVNYILIVWDHD